MNGLDTILLVVILLFTIRGIFRGFVTELIVLVSLVAGFILATAYQTPIANFLEAYLPGIPITVLRIISYILIFVAVVVTLRMIAQQINKLLKITFLQPFNRIAGGAFAFLKVTFIISLIFLIIDFLPQHQYIYKYIKADTSKVVAYVKPLAPYIFKFLGAWLPGASASGLQWFETLQNIDSTAKDLLN